ncbi:MAG: hypothetical protein SHS37scaffold145_60 [Phage 71_18]|nr:MAG: hypothetical protein SHS37scaffold145_60 [Phage 71_18]
MTPAPAPEAVPAPDRMYRGACPHGTYWALLHADAATVAHTTASCPFCGLVELSTVENPD